MLILREILKTNILNQYVNNQRILIMQIFRIFDLKFSPLNTLKKIDRRPTLSTITWATL